MIGVLIDWLIDWLSSGSNWKEVAGKMGLDMARIRFLDDRYRNPVDALLAHLSKQMTTIGQLYDVVVECGMPKIADFL